MPATRANRCVAVIVLALVSGCAGTTGGMVAQLEAHESRIELTDVPFHAQVTDQCGPAALASVLNDAGVQVTPEELSRLVYLPERNGSLQLELIAATRHFGRIPYQLEPHLGALIYELEAGRPVVVLQNLATGWAPVWHYAVVVGYLGDEERFVLRSGDERRLLVKAGRFARSWQRGDFWAFVALEPGELPADANADRYLRAVAGVESTGQFRAAADAYRAATEAWPDNGLAWLGLGNAAYQEGMLDDAGSAYRRLLQFEPGNAIALNNLSQVYLEQGCRSEALAAVGTGLARIDADDPLRTHLLRTLDEVKQSNAAGACPQVMQTARSSPGSRF